MWRIVPAILWGVSFVTLPDRFSGFWAPKDMAWLVGSWGLAFSVWWNPTSRQSVFNPWLGMLLSWCLLSFSWTVLIPQLLVKSTVDHVAILPWNIWPILPLLTLVGSALAYDSLVRHTANPFVWRRVALHLMWISAIFAIHGIAQVLHLDPFRFADRAITGWTHSRADPIGLLGNRTLLGQFLAILAPLSLMFRPWWCQAIYGLCWGTILLTGSVSSMVALSVASGIVWLMQRRWRLFMGLLIASGLSLLIGFSHPTLLDPGNRLAMWRDVLTFWKSDPVHAWLGWGLGSVGMFTTSGRWSYGMLHNEPLQILFETGLVGLALSLGMVFTILRRILRADWSVELSGWVGSLSAFLLIALIGFPLRIGSFLMVGVCCWAAVDALTRGAFIE